MLSLDVDLVKVGSLITSKIKAGVVASRHRQLYNRIAVVAEKYEDVFSPDTPVQVMNPEALTEAEARALLYAPDHSFIDAATSAIGVKYRASIKTCQDILNGRFTVSDEAIPFEPCNPPLSELPGRGMLSFFVRADVVNHTGEDVITHAGEDVVNHTGQDVVNYTGEDVVSHAGEDVVNHAGEDVVNHAGEDVVNHVGEDVVNHVGEGIANYSLSRPSARHPFNKSIQSIVVRVKGQPVETRFELSTHDMKEQYLIDMVVRKIKQGQAKCRQKMRPKGVVRVTLFNTAWDDIQMESKAWEQAHSDYLACSLFWLDTGIRRILVKQESDVYVLCEVKGGRMPSTHVFEHMVNNSPGKEWLMHELRSYLNSRRQGSDVFLRGLKGFVVENGKFLRNEVVEELVFDLQRKQVRVSAILRASGICCEAFTAWNNRARLQTVIRFECELKHYSNQVQDEITKYVAFIDSELGYITSFAQGKGRRPNFRTGSRLEEILPLATKNRALFLERLRRAKSVLEFPEVNQFERKMPFKQRTVDWYTEWLRDFQETNCVRRVHIKGEQLKPIVFVGEYEDLLVLGDGRAVCIIVKSATATRRSRLKSLESETATSHNVLYATFILSCLTGMENELFSILKVGKVGLDMLVKSTERLSRELMRSDKEVSVMDIEHEVDKRLRHLDQKMKQTVTRTVIDLLLSGPVCPAVETCGSISSCYIDTIHTHRVESRGKLVLDNLVPLGGTKVWASAGEIKLTANRSNFSKAVRLSRKRGDRWDIWDAGLYIPPKDNEFIADHTMRCG